MSNDNSVQATSLPADEQCDHQISPLEKMTGTFVNSYNTTVSALGKLNKWECTEHMRDALLILAECKFPNEVLFAGARAYWDGDEVEDIDESCINDMQGALQAMLRSIASPQQDGDRSAPPNGEEVA